jgi:O-antigen/teichoic acid export membrane protein
VTISRGLAGRMGWGIADQAFSSLTNFALGIIVARLVAPAEFGAFALVFATYLIGLNVIRALATQPLAIRFSAVPPAELRAAAAEATGLVLILGVAASVASLAMAAVLPEPVRGALLGLALFLPFLLLQDAWRFVLFTQGRGGRAFVNDVAWALVLFPAAIVLSLTGAASLPTLVAAWGAAGATGAVLGVAQTGVVPNPVRARAWWRAQRDLGVRYMTADVTWAAAGQIGVFLIAGIAGLAAAGALRSAQLLVGPVNIVLQGVSLLSVPEGVRLLDRSAAQLRRGLVALTIVTTGAAVGWAVVLLLLPDWLGRELLGASWPGARAVLLPVGIAWIALALQVPAMAGLKVFAAAGRTLRVSILTAVLTVIASGAGATIGGAEGAAWLLALVAVVAVPAWWLPLRSEYRSSTAPLGPAATAPEPLSTGPA